MTCVNLKNLKRYPNLTHARVFVLPCVCAGVRVCVCMCVGVGGTHWHVQLKTIMAASYQLPKLKAERLSVLVDLAQGVCGGIPSSLEQDDESSDGRHSLFFFIILFFSFFFKIRVGLAGTLFAVFPHCREILRCNCEVQRLRSNPGTQQHLEQFVVASLVSFQFRPVKRT